VRIRLFRVFLALVALVLLAPATSQAALQKTIHFPRGVQTATVRWSHPFGLYVVGTAFEGNTFWAQGDPVKGWRWGYLGGEVHFCVWIRNGYLGAGGPHADNKCGAPRSDPPNTPPAGASKVWTSPSGADGIDTTLNPAKAACGGQTRRFANAQPWAPPVQLVHPMGPPLTAVHRVRVRYLTGDGSVVLVHEGRLGSTGGYPSNWYFVPAACVNLPS
jgi:hypothetical protein